MNDSNDRLKLPVTLHMNDGREILGDLIVSIGGAVDRTLNSDARFLLFADLGGAERYIAKTAIAEVTQRKTAKVVNLPTQAKIEGADPYELLGIEKTATDDQIRDAWHKKARMYHADRFSNVELPPEVSAYTNAMSLRINEAHAVLTAGKKAPAAASTMAV